MAIPISKLKGLSEQVASRLRTHGIANSDQLLEAARTPAGRQALAEKIGVEPRAVLELANRADLARIRGVAGIFGDLLEHAGVDTVKELAARNPANLHRAGGNQCTGTLGRPRAKRRDGGRLGGTGQGTARDHRVLGRSRAAAARRTVERIRANAPQGHTCP